LQGPYIDVYQLRTGTRYRRPGIWTVCRFQILYNSGVKVWPISDNCPFFAKLSILTVIACLVSPTISAIDGAGEPANPPPRFYVNIIYFMHTPIIVL